MNTAQHGYLSPDGRRRLVIATPTGPPFDSAFCRRLFARLDGIEADVRRATAPGAPVTTIAYAGGHRIAVETESIMKREATLNTITSVAGILLFLLLVYRSPWLFLVGAIPMSVATIASVAINGLLHDQLSAAATGTSALLFGLGIDGLVLMYSRYLEELESGRSVMDAIGGMGGAGTSMLLGSFTTAATFFGLTWIDLPGLQELGRLIGIGMLIGGPLTLLLVAAMVPGRLKRPRGLSMTWLAPFIRRNRHAILWAAAVVTITAVPMASHLELDLRLQRLQPNTPAVRLQNTIAEQFGVDRDVAVALAQGPRLDDLVRVERRFTAAVASSDHPLSVTGPSQLLPPAADQDATGRLLAALPDVNIMQARFSDAAFDAGFQPGAFDAFTARLPRLLDPGRRLTYQGYVDHGLKDLIARYVVPDAGGFTTASYAEIDGPAHLARARAAASAAGPPLVLTGVPVVNADLAAHFRPQFIIALAAGLVVVFLMMLVTFRRVGLTALALLPTVLGLVWAAALLAVCGVQLDLFSVFAVLTLIGIGVDYGIHLVHRVATEPGGFDLALARIVPSNLVAAVIALLGCGSLVTSTYPPLRSLGIVTVVGLCTCLTSSVLVLPALLLRFAPRTPHES
jgi:predicted RND superfamily exporter protein